LPGLDYEQVIKLKMTALKELYTLQKEEFLLTKDLLIFLKQQKLAGAICSFLLPEG